MSSNILRAALYIRVSSEEQAMHGLSLAAQRESLTGYAQAHGYRIVDYYADEGVTARKKYRNRPAFMRMMEDIRAGQIDIILFIKLDRWFRNIADYYEVQRELDRYGVEWAATEERYDTTTANGRLNLNIRLAIAQDESDRTAERIKFVFRDKVRRGEVISGKVPFGYKIENKRMVPDPDTAPVAQEVFDYYLSCRSISQTRKHLIRKYSMFYSITGLRVFLQNRRYLGEAHGESDFCEPLIEKGKFDMVQQLIQERAQRSCTTHPDRVYLFSSIVYCAECGNRLSSKLIRGKYTYYRCTRHEHLYPCPHRKSTSELKLEQWLLTNLSMQFAQYNSELAAARARIKPVDTARIRAKMTKLKDLYLNDLIDREEYERDYTALRDTLAQPAPSLPAPVDLSCLDDMHEIYSGLNRSEKKAFWSRLIQKIIIDNDDHFKVIPAPSLPKAK